MFKAEMSKEDRMKQLCSNNQLFAEMSLLGNFYQLVRHGFDSLRESSYNEGAYLTYISEINLGISLMYLYSEVNRNDEKYVKDFGTRLCSPSHHQIL